MRADLATLLRTAAIVFVLGSPWLVMRVFGDGQSVTNLFTPLTGEATGENPAAARITTGDAQAYDQLWISLDDLQGRGATLSPDEFTRRTIELTAEFLELEASDEEQLSSTADRALAAIDSARAKLDSALPTDRQAAWGAWQAAQTGIAADLAADLAAERPRHVLLTEESKRWLLRLDYGRRSAKGAATPD